MRNLRLDICYDGTRYRGWQRLPGRDDTIQGKLETALSRILEEPIEVSGSGRIDAGVHALHQAANFHCESAMPAGGSPPDLADENPRRRAPPRTIRELISVRRREPRSWLLLRVRS